MSCKLKQFYQEQLIQVGVSPYRAKKASEVLTLTELMLIGEIWGDWADVLAQSKL